MDRPLSMTELQIIRAALETADNFAALIDLEDGQLPGQSPHSGELAAMVEGVHRALAVVDRRINALNRRAVERLAGAEQTEHVPHVQVLVGRTPLDVTKLAERQPEPCGAVVAGEACTRPDEHEGPCEVSQHIYGSAPSAELLKWLREKAHAAGLSWPPLQRVYGPNDITCACGHLRSLHAPAPLITPDPSTVGSCNHPQCACLGFLSLTAAKRASDLAALRSMLLAQGPYGRGDQSNGAQSCTCDGAHSEDCGAHGFSVLALRKRYGHACPQCTMPASHAEPVHKCKHCGRTQDGPG